SLVTARSRVVKTGIADGTTYPSIRNDPDPDVVLTRARPIDGSAGMSVSFMGMKVPVKFAIARPPLAASKIWLPLGIGSLPRRSQRGPLPPPVALFSSAFASPPPPNPRGPAPPSPPASSNAAAPPAKPRAMTLCFMDLLAILDQRPRASTILHR